MGLFSRSKEGSAAPALKAALRYGRRMRSDLDPEQTMALLEELLSTYRPRQHAHLPFVTPAGFRVADGVVPPERFVGFEDAAREAFFLALWPDKTMALFALADEDFGNTSLIGHWKLRDGSLTSIGQLAPNTIGLDAPRVPVGYLEGILQACGKPVTPGNLTQLARELGVLFLIKATQFIEGGLKIPARPFVDRHSPVTSAAGLQAILDDLGSNLRVLPYIQDLPPRIRAVVLEDLDGFAGLRTLPD